MKESASAAMKARIKELETQYKVKVKILPSHEYKGDRFSVFIALRQAQCDGCVIFCDP